MNIHYFIETYRHGFDVPKTDNMNVHLKYYDFEKKFINHINDNRFSIIKKSRQMHVTTLLANYVAYQLIFGWNNDKDVPLNIHYISFNDKMAHIFKKEVKKALGNFYTHSKYASTSIVRDYKKYIELTHGNRLVCTNPSANSIIGARPDIVIFDEASSIKNLAELYNFINTSIGTKGKFIITSTPNGNEMFAKLFFKSVLGWNDFKHLSLSCVDNEKYYSEEWLLNMFSIMGDNSPQVQQEIYGKFVFTFDEYLEVFRGLIEAGIKMNKPFLYPDLSYLDVILQDNLRKLSV